MTIKYLKINRVEYFLQQGFPFRLGYLFKYRVNTNMPETHYSLTVFVKLTTMSLYRLISPLYHCQTAIQLIDLQKFDLKLSFYLLTAIL